LPIRPALSARRTRVLSGVSGVVTTLVVGALLTVAGLVIPAQSASASSEITVTAADQDADVENAPFPKLAVTVSQTTNLLSQGLEISWTGGKKSTVPNGQTGGENFLQIAQCWGSDADDPTKPDRTTCQYGAFLTSGATRDSTRNSDTGIAEEDVEYTVPSASFFDPAYTAVPFTSATGKTIASVVGGVKVPGVDVNTNEFFTQFTSNEISWAGSGADGTGSAKFELQTALQSPGLGCGTPVTAADGTVSGSDCWLVVIPRGTADAGEQSITKSGLLWDTWKHAVSVKLDFQPIGVHCAIGSAERQISGSELIAGAVASWQPKLCSAQNGAVYSLLTGSESDAAVVANSTPEAALALTSQALRADGADALAYAPVALTGLSIGFAVDRQPSASADTPADVSARARLPFETLKLTPRLVAKLLTNSYLDSLPYDSDRTHLNYVSSADPGKNARNITFDPDFLAINDPEWAYQRIVSPSMSDLLVPQGRSNGASALWEYVMSDEKAVAFLNGQADEWGMIVNPWSSIDAATNPSGTALQLPRDNFPKADPVEQAANDAVGPINLVTWRPYTNDFDTGAYYALRGDGQILGGWDSLSSPPKYAKATRSLPGSQRVLSLTDTASAAKYQVFSAALLNPAGEYVAPTTESLTAAAAVMTASSGQAQVYGFDPESAAAKGATTAYPLAMPVYAATNPAIGQAGLRASYAAFIRYAATTGQTPGTDIGQLPDGYAPIPEGWKAQALAAASVIESGVTATTQSSPSQASAVSQSSASSASGTLDPVAAASAPSATGDVVMALAGKATPDDPASSAIEAAVPGSLLAGLASALLVPFITRIRRRVL